MYYPAGPEIPPWKFREQWHQALQSIEISSQHRWERLGKARILAGTLRKDLSELSDRIEALCSHTCTTCDDICCNRATVWFDFRDLLFLYLNFGTFPAGQVKRELNGACSCLSPTGCTLDRLYRPFICTWYCCSDQTGLMDREGKGARQAFNAAIARVKANRIAMETEFIAALV